MSAHPPRLRGFTLMEMMVVLAIIGILTAMAASAAQKIGARNGTQNASSDLSAILSKARARAEFRGGDVYVIIYPRMTAAGALTGGSGAVFVYEDMNGDFLTGSGGCSGSASPDDCSWQNFVPPNAISPPPTSNDRLLDVVYLDSYQGKNVRFGKPAVATAPWAMPFSGIGAAADTNGCSFCGTTTHKGAIVFTGEQMLRFLDDAGQPVAQRTAGIALQSKDNPRNTFLFGLVGATGLVTLVK